MDTSSTIRIANPLYDVVFRYLMDDNKIACLFISAIIGEEVKELVFQPTKYSMNIGGEQGITVIRMDFSAKIIQEDGSEKLLIIELQKAKFYHQTMRFRRYLGKQYQNKENYNPSTKEALPILPIYILGESFTEKVVPVLQIQREYKDAATQEILTEKHPFIETLTHDTIIIQIPHLKNNRRNRLEQFLAIFDQQYAEVKNKHFLQLNPKDYPEEYEPIMRRLITAANDPIIEETMDIEDEIVDTLNRKEKDLLLAKKDAEQAKKDAEQAKKESQKLKTQLKSTIANLTTKGFSTAEIATIMQLSEAEVKEILSS